MKTITLLFLFTYFFSFSILAQNGLKAEYYDGTNFNRLVGTQIESDVNYYWDKIPPFPDMNPNECSVRLTGRLSSPKTGEIKLLARVDDGVRIWIGNKLIINNWQLNDNGYSKGVFTMKAGEIYDIKIEYFNALYEAELRLFWIFPRPDNLSWYESFWYEDKQEIIPAEYFFLPIENEPEIVEEEVQIEAVKKPVKKKTIVKPKKKSIASKAEVLRKMVIEDYIPKNVQFDRAKTEILPASFAELDKLSAYLIKNSDYKIKIEGHTDNVGDAAKNLKLSHSRARAVAAYLINKGVSPERLSAEGFGGSRPLMKSDGRKYHPENRRVEFIVE